MVDTLPTVNGIDDLYQFYVKHYLVFSFAIAVVCMLIISPISLMAEAHFQPSVDSEGFSSLTSDGPSVTLEINRGAPLITPQVV